MLEKTRDEVNVLREDRIKLETDHNDKVEEMTIDHKLEMDRTLSACIADGVATQKNEMRILDDQTNVYND